MSLDPMDKLPTVYLAGAWDQRHHVREAAQEFKAAGFGLTTTWWDREPTDDPILLRQLALNDIQQVLACHLFVLLNSQPRGQETSGKAVETGIALISLKGMILVGDPTNIFHHLKLIRVETVTEAVAAAKKLKPLEYVLEGITVRSVEAKYD